MVAVNCAAIPAQLVESTLFGHVKGAFTGATQAGTGVFEAASGGTVLLDEIAELPPPAQSALLRVLETKRVTRVGSTKEIEVDVRIMAATHRDLEAMSAEGTFRQDLYYRLNALTLELPPLRNRREDIAPLANRSLSEANASNQRSVRGLTPDALEALKAYPWPGNVRELRNVIERAVVIADDDVITLADLPQRLRARFDTMPPPPEEGAAPEKSATGTPRHRRTDESFRECIERIETDLILGALQEAGGNQSEAARILTMPRRTFINKMTGLGIRKRGYGVE
jgi:DNA-binding NtrC family response regulator